jgi:hypothetical protein
MRRYLESNEIDLALRRGRSVECFLGPCIRDGRNGIRWLTIRKHGDLTKVSLYESEDAGSSDFIDLYEFGSLDPARESDEPAEQLVFSDLSACIAALSARFPDGALRFVNEGVIQDEYADFIAGRSS